MANLVISFYSLIVYGHRSLSPIPAQFQIKKKESQFLSLRDLVTADHAQLIHGGLTASNGCRTAEVRLAVAILLTAVAAVIFSFAAPSVETPRIFFSTDDSSSLNSTLVDFKELEVNSDGGLLAAPPLDFEDTVISEQSDDIEVVINSTSITSPAPSPTEIFSVNQVKWDSPDTQLEVPPSPIEISDSNNHEFDAGHPERLPPKSKLPADLDSNEATSISGGPREQPFLIEKPTSLTETDWQLIEAKKEIDNAPVISDDPDLYAPLFQNVSVFKRSYELMESTLKVYIYKDGQRPIFHTPVLKGIYASEGWFLKLMEANKKFVAKNPHKAHLFYLPYSARQLENTLYKPDSHNLKPLAIFLKNYVNSLSANYPFWNRTRGADHFLVACHDWGPYTIRLHQELNKNTIKALCNADLSEGFIQGRDVSLPETLIGNPRRPLRDLGGKPVSKRTILAFFAGNMHGRVRPILVNYWSGKDEDMKIYGPLPARVSRKMSYVQHMKSSKFCICPMGYEVNSPRIVEAIYYECVPVIIADNFALPFGEVLDWSAFSVVIAEKDISNLKDILLEIPLKKYFLLHENVKRLQRHFLWHPKPVKYDIFHMILHSVWFNRVNQMQV